MDEAPNTSGPCPGETALLHFTHGVLGAHAHARVEDHVDRCPLCRQTLAAFARAQGDILSSGASVTSAEDEGATGLLPLRGQTIGRYVVLDCIGSGGMGVVYAAYDPELDRKVSLKLLRPDRALGQARLMLAREAQAMARLSHPNVVNVHDVGEADGVLFVAMELVDGGTVSRWLRERPRSWREVLRVFLGAGEGLAAAHAAGLVHRDFKPNNVLVGRDGRARVTDFGLARAIRADGERGPPAGAPLEASGFSGTPAYFAPEQLERQSADARTDQFSFAVSLYEALYGERPYAGTSLRELALELRGGAIRPAPRNASVPPYLRRVLLRALSRSPSDRYESMEALLRALERDPVRARRALAAGLTAVALLFVAGVTWLRAQEANACTGAPERVLAVWGPPQAAALRAAFGKSGAPFAARAADGAVERLDSYAKAWVEMHRASCQATRERGEQSGALLDLRMRCLNLRLADLGALTALLLEPDAQVLERAAQAAASLPPVAACGSAELLRAPVQPPATPALAGRVEAVRALNSQLWALRVAGKFAQGVPLARERTATARKLGYPPLLAEALLLEGQLLQGSGDFKGASKALLEGLDSAEACRHDVVAAKLWIELVFVAGYYQTRHEEAHLWVRRAQAAIARLGGDDALEAALANVEGAVLLSEGRFEEARAVFERALALLRERLGPEDLEVCRVLGNLGTTLAKLGRIEEALALHRQAVELAQRSVGPDHPDVAQYLNSLCTDLDHLGRREEALPLQRRVLELRERAFGPDHPLVAGALNNLCVVLGALGRTEEALPLCHRARDVIIRTMGPKSARLPIILNSEGAVLARGGRHAQALARYEEALALREKALGGEHPDLVTDLVGVGQQRVALGQPGKAAAPLVRALALYERLGGAPARAGDARFALAQALWSSERGRAQQLAAAAVVDFGKAGPLGKERLEALRRWERERGR